MLSDGLVSGMLSEGQHLKVPILELGINLAVYMAIEPIFKLISKLELCVHLNPALEVINVLSVDIILNLSTELAQVNLAI